MGALHLIDGDGHAFLAGPEHTGSLWDLAAVDAILRAFGGQVTDFTGRPVRYDRLDPALGHGMIATVNAEAGARLAKLGSRLGLLA